MATLTKNEANAESAKPNKSWRVSEQYWVAEVCWLGVSLVLAMVVLFFGNFVTVKQGEARRKKKWIRDERQASQNYSRRPGSSAQRSYHS